MTPTEVHQLLKKCKAATISHKIDRFYKLDDDALRNLTPENIQTLAENYLAALEVIKYYRGSDDDETSWMEPDQHLMYWTLWNDGDCVGGKVANDFLKKVGCE